MCLRAIFMLQTINVGGKNLNVFYDSGCGDIVVKKSAIDSLIKMGRAKLGRTRTHNFVGRG